ncbi:GIY-YIG nuclease family protein [Leeuwenhoekiella nanhaiensis]|uniref:Endonuclease n=1 Tax=Leeuwenhoekiella nanhaiensis TaxID=1655491 RepID=A0A2G1VN81_9FLAO|nr:GIY-YIG nuclease family protein [Leeuwenhoekiella nanhaiensis]PHQ28227.1 endonuclease [Leeuwenhoekiella nanhaiensis]
MEELFYTYILTNKNHTVLYIGVTADLKKRLRQHTQKSNKGFTGKYNVEKLVYFESTPYVNNAIHREKQLKKWNREWKENLISDMNPDWNDLSWMLE